MENDENTSVSSTEIYRRLFPFVRPYRARLIIGVLCGILQGGATFGIIVALYWGLGLISGEEVGNLNGIPSFGEAEGTAGDIGLKRLVFTVSILPVVTILQGILFFGGKYLVEWVGNRVVADLRKSSSASFKE